MHIRLASIALALTIACCVLSSSATAHADVAPSAPAPCDVQSWQRPGVTCQLCAASYRQPDRCRGTLGAQGYAQRCRSSGASVWHEVWCRGPAAAPPPVSKDGSGCGACTVDAPGGGTEAALVLVALAACAWSFRRRKQRATPSNRGQQGPR